MEPEEVFMNTLKYTKEKEKNVTHAIVLLKWKKLRAGVHTSVRLVKNEVEKPWRISQQNNGFLLLFYAL